MTSTVAHFREYDQRLSQIRAGFVSQGTSLHAWCQTNGIDTQNARKAIVGIWTGPKATALVARIEGAAGVKAS
jgi:hypothetical protein